MIFNIPLTFIQSRKKGKKKRLESLYRSRSNCGRFERNKARQKKQKKLTVKSRLRPIHFNEVKKKKSFFQN